MLIQIGCQKSVEFILEGHAFFPPTCFVFFWEESIHTKVPYLLIGKKYVFTSAHRNFVGLIYNDVILLWVDGSTYRRNEVILVRGGGRL